MELKGSKKDPRVNERPRLLKYFHNLLSAIVNLVIFGFHRVRLAEVLMERGAFNALVVNPSEVVHLLFVLVSGFLMIVSFVWFFGSLTKKTGATDIAMRQDELRIRTVWSLTNVAMIIVTLVMRFSEFFISQLNPETFDRSITMMIVLMVLGGLEIYFFSMFFMGKPGDGKSPAEYED